MRPKYLGKRSWISRAIVTTSLVGLFSFFFTSSADAAEPRTQVVLNGKPVPVFFNDGDSFRVLGGTYAGAKARLAGFNTLESYGPVHQWGTWTAKELYVLSKMATMHARRGRWTCTTDGKTDTYGRMLLWCPDLAEDLVRRGLAHAMTVTDEPGHPKLVAAQREAMQRRRGMWAHGVPAFVLTSLHSSEEDIDGKGTYNRLVSTEDGHSVKWRHDDRYRECSRVCFMTYSVDEAKVDEVVAALASEPSAKPWIAGLDPNALRRAVVEFARHRHVGRTVPERHRDDLDRLLGTWATAGRFGEQVASEDGCMIHIDFKRRYGESRAECLR